VYPYSSLSLIHILLIMNFAGRVGRGGGGGLNRKLSSKPYPVCTAKTQYGKFGANIPRTELRRLSPNSSIHVSVSDLCIPMIGLSILLQENLWTDPGNMNRSQTHECGNWDSGRAIPFLEKHKWDFRCSAVFLRY
jgi:hypothetical protein